MKKILLIILLGFSFLVPRNSLVNAQSPSTEQIRQYDVAIDIEADGKIAVVERIEYDFGLQARHGIFREIPFVKTSDPPSSGKEGIAKDQTRRFKMDIEVLGVTDETGQSYKFTKSTSGDDVKLKIGDPDLTITGVHTYAITYRVSGALAYFSDHDELYWDAIGTGWEVPIEIASASVDLPRGVSLHGSALQMKCFAGPEGTSTEDCTVNHQGGRVRFESDGRLDPGEGLTIVVGFPKGLVAQLLPSPMVSFWNTLAGKIVAILLAVIGLLWYLVYPIWIPVKWYKWGRDPDVGIAPTSHFEGPKNKTGRTLTPGETGALIDENVHVRDVFATLVDLARRGHFLIVERKRGDVYLERRHPKEEAEQMSSMQNFEVKLLTDLFTTSDAHPRGVQKRGASVAHPGGGESVGLVRLKDKKLYETVKRVEEMMYKGLVDEGFFPHNPQHVRTFYGAVAIASLVTLNLPLLFLTFIFGPFMPRKTLFGAQATQKAKALRNFLKSQERQLAFQSKHKLMFEKLLPYAVAFGVEKEWAKTFAALELEKPEWYQTYRREPFNSTAMVASLDSSFSSFRRVTMPTRSSSGFSSGFSGGSVGGGGGGGGGSW